MPEVAMLPFHARTPIALLKRYMKSSDPVVAELATLLMEMTGWQITRIHNQTGDFQNGIPRVERVSLAVHALAKTHPPESA